MKALATPLQDLLLIHPQRFSDARGWFMESYSQKKFDALVGREVCFVQDNHSQSGAGVLRGLHFQRPPFTQGKLVRVVSGVVWDVCVDLRRASKTCGQAYGVELSAQNAVQLWVPPGFAHGFVTMSPSVELLYKVTTAYEPGAECSLLWNDPAVAHVWPALRAPPTVSVKDAQGASLEACLALMEVPL